jgi:hypothetical protein
VPDAPVAGDTAGTLITVAPAAGPIGHLLRTAIDAEHVGATRLHLAADQLELEVAVSALREQTNLIITCDASVVGIDTVRSDFRDIDVAAAEDLPTLVAEVARVAAAHPAGVSICGLGSAALPVLLATLAAGGHIRVAADVKDHAALVARASGLARIAGRAPLDAIAARRLLGLS